MALKPLEEVVVIIVVVVVVLVVVVSVVIVVIILVVEEIQERGGPWGGGGGEEGRVHVEEVDSLTRDEVNFAIDTLKRNKASDEGGMVAEILKCADKDSPLREDIFQILDEVWREGVCPKAWNTAIIIPLLKKGDTSIMDNYRGIALQDIVEKVFAKVIYRRLESIIDPQIYEGQFGFRKGRGTVDAIHIIRQVLESSHEYREPLFICFVDIVKAYDSVDRNILWDALADHHVPVVIIDLIKALYYNTTAKVRVGDKFSDPFDLKIGVKQGDILSTLLFNIFLNYIWKKVVSRWGESRGIPMVYGGEDT